MFRPHKCIFTILNLSIGRLLQNHCNNFQLPNNLSTLSIRINVHLVYFELRIVSTKNLQLQNIDEGYYISALLNNQFVVPIFLLFCCAHTIYGMRYGIEMPYIFHITYREINLYKQKTIHSRMYQAPRYTYIVIYIWDLVFDGDINLRYCALQIMTMEYPRIYSASL